MTDSVTITASFDTPGLFRLFIEEINGSARLIEIDESHIRIEIEAPDEFEAGMAMAELRNSLGCVIGESISISSSKSK